jgi:hypothetical protein
VAEAVGASAGTVGAAWVEEAVGVAVKAGACPVLADGPATADDALILACLLRPPKD